jgi:hypothetical protein
MLDRIRNWWKHRAEGEKDTVDARIDSITAGRQFDAFTQSDGGGIPPNYLPTGVDEGRPKK